MPHAPQPVLGAGLLTCTGLASALVLAECYRLVAQVLWADAQLAAALCHSLLALGLCLFLGIRRHALAGTWLPDIRPSALSCLLLSILFLGVLLRVSISWGLMLGVAPLVEEFVFRRGFTRLLQSYSRQSLGACYVSALTFSWLHSIPTCDRILAGETNLSLGPFLLAACCELIYSQTQRLLVVVAFHMACNGAALALGSSRHWLAAQLIALLA